MTKPTRQTIWNVGTHEQRLCVRGSCAAVLPQRNGFTLVELLVVITIIGVLAALITPAVFQARRTGQISAIKAEIDLLHMAMMNYKNEYGSFPPLQANATNHLSRLFPRCSTTAIQASLLIYQKDRPFGTYVDNFNNRQRWSLPQVGITRSNALVCWLSGYAKNPTQPVVDVTESTGLDPYYRAGSSGTIIDIGGPTGAVSPPTLAPRTALMEFDRSRIDNNLQFHPRDKAQSPYIYIPSSLYNSTGSIAELDPVTGSYYNLDTFQILCNGLDETWNTDDDLSNFWKGTRGDQ